jgi:hypothetical protein
MSLLDIRQHFQSARIRMATISSDIRQYDIGQYLTGTADGDY